MRNPSFSKPERLGKSQKSRKNQEKRRGARLDFALGKILTAIRDFDVETKLTGCRYGITLLCGSEFSSAFDTRKSSVLENVIMLCV